MTAGLFYKGFEQSVDFLYIRPNRIMVEGYTNWVGDITREGIVMSYKRKKSLSKDIHRLRRYMEEKRPMTRTEIITDHDSIVVIEPYTISSNRLRECCECRTCLTQRGEMKADIFYVEGKSFYCIPCVMRKKVEGFEIITEI